MLTSVHQVCNTIIAKRHKETENMKLAIGKWNVVEKGNNKPFIYFGFKTKRAAQEWANAWNKTHTLQLEVIKII